MSGLADYSREAIPATEPPRLQRWGRKATVRGKMKRCPQCNATYGDSLQFCSQDGTPLEADASARFDTQPATTLALPRGPSTPQPHDIISANYIFLDVVGFTRNRSIEAQSDIVNALNSVVRDSVSAHNIPEDRIIYIPTGDGICIALLNVERPFDIHIQIALGILERTQKHNNAVENEMRKFEVRIGINANTDNLVTDINGQRNVAGAGISQAARIMDKADGSQILVGRSVYDTLRYREKYATAFKHYRATAKHGTVLDVYQFVSEGCDGLNTDTPQAFVASGVRAVPSTEVRIKVIRGHEEIYKAYEEALKNLSKGEPHVIRTVASLPPSADVAKKWDSFLVPFLETRSEVTYKRTIIVNGTSSEWTRRKKELQQRYLAKRLSNYKQFEAEGPPSIECLLLDDSLAFVTFASAGRPFESSGLRVKDKRICRELEHYFENQLLPLCERK